MQVRYTGPVVCPHCQGTRLLSKGRYQRLVRHDDIGLRPCYLALDARKWKCQTCGKQFRQRFPGILRWQRASESFQQAIFRWHLDGVNRSRLGRREGISPATVERYFERGLERQFRHWHPPVCPPVLGIDEHFFTRKLGYATTFCDLRRHKVYDVVLGRSEKALETYLERLQGRDRVRVVCIDLSSTYRSLVRKYFPNALIVADRFHVIRLVLHHFHACWRNLDPQGSHDRGLVSLMRRHASRLSAEQQLRLAAYLEEHPAFQPIHHFRQELWQLLLHKRCNQRQCLALATQLLHAIEELCNAILPPLTTLGQTLADWQQEIARMWRFSRNNGITEGFHTKMEMISRQAFGFRNFQNYRMRVKVLCA